VNCEYVKNKKSAKQIAREGQVVCDDSDEYFKEICLPENFGAKSAIRERSA
jgi:hypothetical protein